MQELPLRLENRGRVGVTNKASLQDKLGGSVEH